MEEEDACTSSFLKEVRGKLKRGLQPTQTKVTTSDGSVTILEKQGQVVTKSLEEKTVGFIVDLKPDLTIGRVRSWLLISSQDVPNDFSLVNEYNIVYVLSLIPNFVLQSTVLSVIKEHLCLPIYDEECFSLTDSIYIKKGMNFIHQAKNSIDEGTCILVHCNAGISRAPTMVIFYLMMYENLSFDEAYNAVLKVRPNMKPNNGFLKQLKSYRM